MDSALANRIAQARAAYAAGDLAGASAHCDEALAMDPAEPDALFIAGHVARRRGDLEGAIGRFRAAQGVAPHRPDIAQSLGNTLLAAGNASAATIALKQATALAPTSLPAWTNLAAALDRSGDTRGAETALRQALGLDPASEQVLTNLAGLLSRQGRKAEGATLAGRATRADPGQPDAWTCLGETLHGTGDFTGAARAYEQALALAPHHSLARYNRGHLHLDCWRLADGLRDLAAATTLDPDYAPAWHSYLMTSLYDPDITPGELAARHRHWGSRVPRPLRARSSSATVAPTAGRRIRIGYLSPDFRRHSCAYFLRPLFGAHDRQRFELFGYSAVARPDTETGWFQHQMDHWRTVTGQRTEEVATRIAADLVDVLVDLGGHTAGQPVAVLAYRPAPRQIAWLGYPAANGLAETDARITDVVADPPDGAPVDPVDRPLQLEGCFVCYQPPAEAPAVSLRSTSGPPVFGCFNHAAKLNPRVVATWARLLARIPGARLLLKARQFAAVEARAAVVSAFAGEGIDPQRIEIRPWSVSIASALAAYAEVDVALDPFPYNGTTTTLEAIWMGVPVVTLRGDRHSGRVGASLLTSLGATTWIADDSAAYVDVAEQLVTDRAALAEIRAGLRARLAASPLCDGAGFASRFEAAVANLLQGAAAT